MRNHRRLILSMLVCLLVGLSAHAQSTSTIYGSVRDASGAAIASATVVVHNEGTGLERTVSTDSTGNYQITALPNGLYRVEASAPSMGKQIVKGLQVEVSSNVQQNFNMKVASTSETVEVSGAAPVVEASTMTVGQVINERTVQEIPLNGRHFVDLGLLVPGSVAPPANGFLTAPLRGQGSFAFNTAGQREDTVNFMVNGINLNDMSQNQITFQPSINTVDEFKVDNSTYSAEYGRNSGAIVNIATRSGTNSYHGELFDFVRNDMFDAKNFFTRPPAHIPPFKRNNFGASIGGPIVKDKTFFFASYEGTRQRQGVALNGRVLTDAQRAGVTDPTSLKLLSVIPQANAVDPKVPGLIDTFIGAGTAPVNIDQWTGDVSHHFSEKDVLHGYYAFQKDARIEPVLNGATVPGFGDTRTSHRQILTINETHTFSPTVVNELRLGMNRIHITFVPTAALNPVDFGINDGITTPVGIPQILVSDIGLTFGGSGNNFPQGRGDTTAALGDTVTWAHGRHTFHIGGEARRFYNNNFTGDIGSATFSTVSTFQTGAVRQFQITGGNRPSRILEPAYGGFVQDNYKIRPTLTLELGLRYDWNATPTEAENRFTVFDPATASLVQIGHGRDLPFAQNNKNFQPRVGFAWDVFGSGRTILRSGFAVLTDQFVTGVVTGLSSNPPFATTQQFNSATSTIKLSSAGSAGFAALSPNTIDPNFKNAYVQSWNLNIEQAVSPTLGVTVGYFGSKANHLRNSINLDQKINGVVPFPSVSANSAIAPGKLISGTITEITSDSSANYNALWLTANKRMGHGIQFNTSYTYSKSLDDNSLSSDAIRVQDATNPHGDYGLSDFDVRHRFVANVIYELPFQRNRLVKGWQLSTITQLQSGNPVPNIIASGFFNLTGTNTVRPDILRPVVTTGNPDQWFANPVVCDPTKTSGPLQCTSSSVFALPESSTGALHFGNLGRNSIIGPNFINSDFSIQKTTRINERFSHQFRFEAFDLFNHPNFGNPTRTASLGTIAKDGTLVLPAFGTITGTRFPTGDSGSSRQLQFAMKLIF
jgi:outer membrane receptor protein involved in Fe transport